APHARWRVPPRLSGTSPPTQVRLLSRSPAPRRRRRLTGGRAGPPVSPRAAAPLPRPPTAAGPRSTGASRLAPDLGPEGGPGNPRRAPRRPPPPPPPTPPPLPPRGAPWPRGPPTPPPPRRPAPAQPPPPPAPPRPHAHLRSQPLPSPPARNEHQIGQVDSPD